MERKPPPLGLPGAVNEDVFILHSYTPVFTSLCIESWRKSSAKQEVLSPNLQRKHTMWNNSHLADNKDPYPCVKASGMDLHVFRRKSQTQQARDVLHLPYTQSHSCLPLLYCSCAEHFLLHVTALLIGCTHTHSQPPWLALSWSCFPWLGSVWQAQPMLGPVVPQKPELECRLGQSDSF